MTADNTWMGVSVQRSPWGLSTYADMENCRQIYRGGLKLPSNR
jgi:hypothetical protein